MSSALDAQRSLLMSGVLHGQKRGPDSVDMATRTRWRHFDHHNPNLPDQDVVGTGLLFKILLQEIQKAGLHDRMDRNDHNEVPPYLPETATNSMENKASHS